MTVDEYLAVNALHRRDVIEAVERVVGLDSDDALLVSGSLAVGLGNGRSDLDLYLFTSRDLSGKLEGTMVPVPCGPVVGDLEWVPPARWDSARGALSAADGKLRDGLKISVGELDFLHRIRVGEALVGSAAIEALKAQVRWASLRRVLFHRAVTGIEALQIDLLGASEARDALGLRVLVPRLVGHVVDLVLSSNDVTNPSEKWRWHHLLQVAPANLYRRLHALAFDTPSDLASARARARSAVVLANDLVVQAQTGEPEARGTDASTGDPVSTQDILPALSLDAAVRYDGGAFRLYRLCGSLEITCNREMAKVTLLFDGETSRGQAIAEVCAWFGLPPAAGSALLEDIETALAGYGIVGCDR